MIAVLEAFEKVGFCSYLNQMKEIDFYICGGGQGYIFSAVFLNF